MINKDYLLKKYVFETGTKCIENSHSVLNRNLNDANDIARAYLEEIKDKGIKTKESLILALGEENFMDFIEELGREDLKHIVYGYGYNDLSEYIFDLYCDESIIFNFKSPRNITELVKSVEEIFEIDCFIVQDLSTDYIAEVKTLLSEDKSLDINSKNFIMEAAELFSPVFDSYAAHFSQNEFFNNLDKISI